MPAPLVAARWRVPAVIAIVLAAMLVAGLSVALHERTTTSFDTWVFRRLYVHVGTTGATALLDASTPAIGIVLLAVVAIGGALVRRYDVTVLAVLAPVGAVLVTEVILKPVVGRLSTSAALLGLEGPSVSRSFPSGHETVVCSAALVLLVVGAQLPLPRAGRLGLWAVLALWVVAGALGLVRFFYHYATDTVGAIGVCTVVVLGTALLLDAPACARLREGERLPVALNR